jgi:hypothetical protein
VYSERKMRRLSTTIHPSKQYCLTSVEAGKPLAMARILLIILLFSFLCALPQPSSAQCDGCATSSAATMLGLHNDGNRGCAACHAPHTASGFGAESENIALWGQNGNPSYGSSLLLGDFNNYVQVAPAHMTSADEEIGGTLLCLSCHDGNLTPQTMMPSQSYRRKVGLLDSSVGRNLPTLLGDASLANEYAFDHPLGADAAVTLRAGLDFSNGTFSVVPGSPYARFMENYGLPVLSPGKRSAWFGVNDAGQPYLLCTTCHNQHVMSIFASTSANPIAGDGGGRLYTTYFFANGPYNPSYDTVPSKRAPSTAQFCRQCHIDMANEGNNGPTVRTTFK